MSEELFPASTVAGDSPRLCWFKRYGVTVQDFGAAGESPETGEYKRWRATGKRYDREQHAEGDTEQEALKELALKMRVRLWNEMDYK